MVDNDREQPKGLGCVIGLLVGLVAMPILYFLSYGPAVWLSFHEWVSNEWLVAIYSPLGWLCRNSSWFREFTRWYEEFWLS